MTLGERTLGGLRTRADKVRARRAMLVREIEHVPPERKAKPRANRQPRRRLDLALKAELGAEARLPALPAMKLGSRLKTGFLSILTIIALWYAFTSAGFTVERATVLGNKLLSHAQIRSIAQVDDRVVFLIDPQEVEARLSKFPEVYAATVRISWPNKVEIQVEERQPVVEWDDAGRIWWISSDGVAFIQHGAWPELVQVKTSEPTLQITTESLDPVINPQVVQAAAQLSSRLPEVKTLHFDREHGLGFENANGWTVYFGTEGDMTLKAEIYRAMVKQLIEKQVQIDLVSLEDQSAPYYRLER